MIPSHPGLPWKPRHFRRVAQTLGLLTLLLASLVFSLVMLRTPTAAASGLVLEYADATTSATTNTPRPHFEIVNNTSSSVSLSNLTIRYWYTEDGTQSQQFWCDYALAGCKMLQVRSSRSLIRPAPRIPIS